MKYNRFSGFLILSACLLGFLSTGADAIPGLSPVWERLYNDNQPFSETNPDHAVNADPDHDGFSNAAECAAGTDPFSGLPPDGFPQLQIAPHPWMEETFELKIPMTYPGKDYLFSSGTTLQDWTPFPESFPGTGFEMIIPLPLESQGGSPPEKAFFRATISDQPNPGGLFTPWELSILSTRPDIAGAVLPSVPPNDGAEPPPPDPNSDGSGPNDRYDASPHDKEIDFIRTPESRYIHISVPGVPQPFTAVDVSDSGKILFGGPVGITDVATQPVGYVWDPSAAPSQRLKPVMFGSVPFALVCRRTVIDEGDTFPYEQMPLPGRDAPPNTGITLSVNLRAIGDDGSVLGNVHYWMTETDGHPEGHVRSINADLVFLWRQNNHQAGHLIGDHRGYSDEGRAVSRDHAVGFLTRPTENSVETLAVTTRQELKEDLNQISPLDIITTQTAALTTGYMNGQITRRGRMEASGGQITRTGRILMPDLINNEFRYVVCGAAATDILPAGTFVDGFSDFPDGQTGSGANQGKWGIGSQGQPFQIRNGNSFKSAPSAHNVLGWDKYGTGIGPSAAQAIWRNGRMHSLSEVVEGAPGGGVRPRKITPSGLVWVGNPEGTTNGLLVPVEVVAPALDHDDNPTEYPLLGTKELKVAKMEYSLTQDGLQIDNDSHRFYVRIPARYLGAAQIQLATEENASPEYNDNEDTINLVTHENTGLQSQSMILVSDDMDDEADGEDDRVDDRTHKTLLNSKVKIASVTLGGTAYPLNMKIDVPWKETAGVRVIFVGGASAFQTQFQDFVKVAKERYAQVGVRLSVDYKNMPVPSDINETEVRTDDGDFHQVGASVHEDVRKLVTAADQSVGRQNYTVFVVQDLALGAAMETILGRSHTKRLTAPVFQSYTRISVLSAIKIMNNGPQGPLRYTLAHELGHLLTNHGHYGIEFPSKPHPGEYGPGQEHFSVSFNLMKPGGTTPTNPLPGNPPYTALNSSKRLTRDQEKMILEELKPSAP